MTAFSSRGTIVVPLAAILLGESESQWGWPAYESTWNLLRRGATDFNELPLFDCYRRHYSKLEKRERVKAQKRYGTRRNDSETIARGRLLQELRLYGEVDENGFTADVDIGENGEITVDGEHAIYVSILRHLKRREVAVNVKGRHKEWERLKEILSELNGGQTLRQPVEHPDFADWPVTGDCQRQFDAILASCGSIRNRHLLDAGSGTGWFSRKFTSLGAYVIGAEPDMARYYVATRLSKVFGFSSAYPAYFLESFVDLLEKRVVHPSELGQTRFEVILFLDKIHEVSDAPWNELQLISEYGNSAYVDAPAGWDPEDVLNHTEFESYEKILDGDNPLYVYTIGKP